MLAYLLACLLIYLLISLAGTPNRDPWQEPLAGTLNKNPIRTYAGNSSRNPSRNIMQELLAETFLARIRSRNP